MIAKHRGFFEKTGVKKVARVHPLTADSLSSPIARQLVLNDVQEAMLTGGIRPNRITINESPGKLPSMATADPIRPRSNSMRLAKGESKRLKNVKRCHENP